MRDRNNPSDVSSLYDTYGRFYKHLPQDKIVNLSDIDAVIGTKGKGTKTLKLAVSAMKKLAEINRISHVSEKLQEINVTQTVFANLQSIDLEEFLCWRDKTLGITASLHKNVHMDVRKAWLWVFSVQIVYALRVSEVFAIKNLDKPFIAKDGEVIPSLDSPLNTFNTIVIGEETIAFCLQSRLYFSAISY